MTESQAYVLLREKWPHRSFAITHEVWHHDHADTGRPNRTAAEYSVYDAKDRLHYYGETLEQAMEAALGCDADLAAVERTISRFPDGSGYEITGPLTQETP